MLSHHHLCSRATVADFVSWHSAADGGGLNLLGVQFEADALTRGEVHTAKSEKGEASVITKGRER